MWQPQINQKKHVYPIHPIALSILQTSFYLPATCGEHFQHLVAAPCTITKHLWRPHLHNYSIHHNGNNPLQHTCSCSLLQTQQVHRESTHFIPSTHSTIEKGKISVLLSLTCPSIPCFYSDTRTRLQHTLSILLQLLFDAIPLHTHSKRQQKSSSVSGGHGSFLLQRMRHFEKQNTCSNGLFFFLCFLFSHDTQHASSGYHGGN